MSPTCGFAPPAAVPLFAVRVTVVEAPWLIEDCAYCLSIVGLGGVPPMTRLPFAVLVSAPLVTVAEFGIVTLFVLAGVTVTGIAMVAVSPGFMAVVRVQVTV